MRNKKIPFRHLESVVLLGFIFIILSVLNYYNLLPQEPYRIYEQMLVIGILYITIAKLLSIKHKYKLMLMLVHCVVVLLCIIVYYSKSIIDILIFGLLIFILTKTAVYARTELEKED